MWRGLSSGSELDRLHHAPYRVAGSPPRLALTRLLYAAAISLLCAPRAELATFGSFCDGRVRAWRVRRRLFGSERGFK